MAVRNFSLSFNALGISSDKLILPVMWRGLLPTLLIAPLSLSLYIYIHALGKNSEREDISTCQEQKYAESAGESFSFWYKLLRFFLSLPLSKSHGEHRVRPCTMGSQLLFNKATTSFSSSLCPCLFSPELSERQHLPLNRVLPRSTPPLPTPTPPQLPHISLVLTARNSFLSTSHFRWKAASCEASLWDLYSTVTLVGGCRARWLQKAPCTKEPFLTTSSRVRVPSHLSFHLD